MYFLCRSISVASHMDYNGLSHFDKLLNLTDALWLEYTIRQRIQIVNHHSKSQEILLSSIYKWCLKMESFGQILGKICSYR